MRDEERLLGNELADRALKLNLVGETTHEQLRAMFVPGSRWHGVQQAFVGMEVLSDLELAAVRRNQDDWDLLGKQEKFRDDLIILRSLGEGGMGQVYQALDTNLDRIVAIKVIRPDKLVSGATARVLARFEREAKVLALLDHPAIVRLYEAKLTPEGHPYMLMDYVPGRPLSDVIKETSAGVQLELILKPPKGETKARDLGATTTATTLAIDLVVAWARELAEGLHACHAKGIIHRDIKPANILVSEKRRVRLIDFGVAFDQNGERLTKEGVAIGTAVYMAPELISGEPPTVQSDVYALGITLYEMLTGLPPFHGADSRAVCLMIASGKVPRLRGPEGKRRDCPAELERIVLRCIAAEPGDRYERMLDLASELEALAAAEETTPPRGTGKALALLLAVVLLLGALLGALAMVLGRGS